ncbi:hypothetical protein ES703_77539 [subsurface metagenome]
MVRRSCCAVRFRCVLRDSKCTGAFVGAGQGTYYDALGEGSLADQCPAGVSAADDETPELEEPERSLAIRHPPEK